MSDNYTELFRLSTNVLASWRADDWEGIDRNFDRLGEYMEAHPPSPSGGVKNGPALSTLPKDEDEVVEIMVESVRRAMGSGIPKNKAVAVLMIKHNLEPHLWQEVLRRLS